MVGDPHRALHQPISPPKQKQPSHDPVSMKPHYASFLTRDKKEEKKNAAHVMVIYRQERIGKLEIKKQEARES